MRAFFTSVGLAVLFLAILMAAAVPVNAIVALLHIPETLVAQLGPVSIFVYGASVFVHVVIATSLLARIERRSPLSYGFSLSGTALPRLGEGIALGGIAAVTVFALMVALRAVQFHGVGLHGADWLWYPVGWAIAIAVAAIAEEAALRGYLLTALSRAMGFIPAAIVTSLLFAYGHMSKPGENATDFASLALLGLVTAYTYWKTGSLWLASGFHWAFDMVQIFVVGTPNGAQKPVGTLLDATFNAPAWITGGPLGTEASWFMFPVIALLFVYVARRFPTRSTTGALADASAFQTSPPVTQSV